MSAQVEEEGRPAAPALQAQRCTGGVYKKVVGPSICAHSSAFLTLFQAFPSRSAGGSVASSSALMLELLDDEASGNQAELQEAR